MTKSTVSRILRASVSRARRTEGKRAVNAFRLQATTKSAGSSARCASRKAK
jgi:hypothetical protein